VLGLTAFANRGGTTLPINQHIAGSIFGSIEVTTDPAGPVTENRTLLMLHATGAPGESYVEVVGGAIPVAITDACPDGTVMQFKFVNGGIVQTFRDHSLLFYVIDDSVDATNALCIVPEQPAKGYFDYVITGGAGRFEGASGSATVEVTSWGVTPELSAEVGRLRGVIELP
jgi:hypothetical protein